MRKLGIALALVVAAALVTSTPAMAQAAKKKQRQRISPHETITATIDGDEMKLVYGRPYTTKPGTTEARKIWGGLVPYGKVWRTGADEATLLTTAQPIEIGGYSLAAGTYSLFTVPDEDGTAKLVINKKTGQWGIPYNEDVGEGQRAGAGRPQEDDPRQDGRPVHDGHRAGGRRGRCSR